MWRPMDRTGAIYMDRLHGGDHIVALAAVVGGDVVGGLAAFVLQEFEQERSEIYNHSLAVAASHRREGTVTILIQERSGAVGVSAVSSAVDIPCELWS